MKTALIEVTQEDIDNGVRSDVDSCPIALAAQRRFPDQALDGVGLAIISFEEQWIDLPPEATDFIETFDDEELPKPGPFTFPVEVPDDWA